MKMFIKNLNVKSQPGSFLLGYRKRGSVSNSSLTVDLRNICKKYTFSNVDSVRLSLFSRRNLQYSQETRQMKLDGRRQLH